MEPEQLLDAIGQLPEEVIAPVAELRRKNPGIRTWIALAASLLLVLGLGISAVLSPRRSVEQEPTEQTAPSGFVITVEVTQVHGDRMLVKREYDFNVMAYSSLLWILTEDIENMPQLTEGDRILVYYDGNIHRNDENSECYITVVYYIEKLN